MPTVASDPPRRRVTTTIAALAITALALLAHRDVPSCALLGVDAYPQILTARIESWTDFFDTFRETLTDGQITGAYYRPVQNLLLAANYAVGRLDPRPYQFTNWAAVGCLAALVFLTTARVLGPSALLAPLVAAALVALHPVLVSIVHGPATRSELLVIIFLLAALFVLPVRAPQSGRDSPGLGVDAQHAVDHPSRAHWLRSLAAAGLSLLAAGSKDTGAVAPLLVLIHQFGFAPSPGLWRRVRHAMLLAAPTVAAVSLFLFVRAQIVGGMGGYPGREKIYWHVFSSTAPLLAPTIACPSLSVAFTSPVAAALALLALLSAAGACAWFGAGDSSVVRARRTLVALGAVWALCSVPLMGFVQHFFFYYAMFPLVGVALVIAAAVDGLRAGKAGTGTLATGRRLDDPSASSPPSVAPAARRALSVTGALLALPIIVGGLFASPLWREYPQFARASRLHKLVYARLDAAIAEARVGQQVRLDVVRRISDPHAVDRTQPVASITVPFAIEAWARMRFPDKAVLVFETERNPFPAPTPDAIAVIIRYVEPDAFEAAQSSGQ